MTEHSSDTVTDAVDAAPQTNGIAEPTHGGPPEAPKGFMKKFMDAVTGRTKK
jgi:hypothetical protein